MAAGHAFSSSCFNVKYTVLLWSFILTISLFHLKYHKRTYSECFSGSLPVDGRDVNGFEISSTSRFPGRHLGDGPQFKRKFLKSRIAYCTAKYSPSFQLLYDSSVLLILRGDISQYPGPLKDLVRFVANVFQKIIEPCHAMDARSRATLGLSVAMLVISNTKNTNK